MSKQYKVEVWADYIQTGDSPEQIKRSLLSCFKREGLDEANFAIDIMRVTERGKDASDDENKIESKNNLIGQKINQGVMQPVKPVKNNEVKSGRGRKPGSKNKVKKGVKKNGRK